MTRMETTTSLNEDTVERIKDLVRINIDSADGFAEAADTVEDGGLKQLFRAMSGTRRGFADELRRYVVINDDDIRPGDEISGSWQAMFHRWWLDLRGSLSGGDAYAVLAEAERGEDKIKEMYEQVLQETAGNPLGEVLHRQYAEVKQGHDRIRDLRDAAKARK